MEPAGSPDTYTFIAGERRWRASKLAGLEEIPAVVMDVSLQAQLELALVENVIRSDLSPLEEAHGLPPAHRRIWPDPGRFADRVGRSRVSVTNTLRLLLLPDRVKAALDADEITEGHARALLGLPSAVEQIAMLETVIRRGLSVRETETAVRAWVDRNSAAQEPSTPGARQRARRTEQRARRTLATNVTINQIGERRFGSIRIDLFIRRPAGRAWTESPGKRSTRRSTRTSHPGARSAVRTQRPRSRRSVSDFASQPCSPA